MPPIRVEAFLTTALYDYASTKVRCGPSNRHGVSKFFFACGFATSRMQLMKSCAIGVGGANTFAAR